ncbi:Outer membrane protein TolC [Pseudarcicella hirudinis]|uniref:Outer membrane protein TolC n=1 Tax=Pseudarcicella hirudinis TaxID=1079859 RepID=A0A1I5TJG7_9BACT|nr:TolC family protein [Pseudarcicella hirudinis]SFP82797.1 Outer membrane protein TolC [Pseudarcicella hirudinis]
MRTLLAYRKYAFYLLTLVPSLSFGQQRLTLNEAIETALKNSLDIQISKNNLSVSAINNHIGVAGGLPTVVGSGSNTEQITTLNQELSNGTSTDKTGVAANNLNMSVTGTYLLYNGYRVVTTKKRLEELQKLNEQQLNSSVQTVIANVMLKYYAVVQQQSVLTTLNRSIDVSKEKLQVIETRRSVGMSNDADLFQAQLDLNAQIQALQTQKIIIAQAKTDLLRTLTINPDSAVEVSDTILVDKAVLWEDIKGSLYKNPDVLAADQQINVNKLLEKEANARRYPSLSAIAGFNYGRSQSAAGFTLLNQTYGPTVGINLSVPIYAGTTVLRQVQIAGVNTQTARLQKEIITQNYLANAAKAWQAYTNTLQLVEAEQKNYDLSGKLLQLMTQRFELGQATVVDVKLAQQTYENSGYRLINLNYTAKSAEITLKQLAYRLSNN